MCDAEPEQVLYNSMFVWNEFLSRGIRNLLHNTIWTVALVYGFFKQVRFFFLYILQRNYEWLKWLKVEVLFTDLN